MSTVKFNKNTYLKKWRFSLFLILLLILMGCSNSKENVLCNAVIEEFEKTDRINTIILKVKYPMFTTDHSSSFAHANFFSNNVFDQKLFEVGSIINIKYFVKDKFIKEFDFSANHNNVCSHS